MSEFSSPGWLTGLDFASEYTWVTVEIFNLLYSTLLYSTLFIAPSILCFPSFFVSILFLLFYFSFNLYSFLSFSHLMSFFYLL